MVWVVAKLSLHSDRVKYITDISESPVTLPKLDFFRYLVENINSVKDYIEMQKTINRFHTVYIDVASGEWQQVSKAQFENFSFSDITKFIENQEKFEEQKDKVELRKKQADSTRNSILDVLWKKKKSK